MTMDQNQIHSFGPYTLHPHQIAGIRWMKQREEDPHCRGGLLCDEMGLGKTITTIGLMVNVPAPLTLILCPIAVLSQWSAHLEASGFAVFTLHTTKPKWLYRGGTATYGVVRIANYEKVSSRREAFQTSTYSRVILDEAHTLRNNTNRGHMDVRRISRTVTWCLTGTPVVNSASDCSSLFALVNGKSSSSKDTLVSWMNRYALCRTTAMIQDSLPSMYPTPKIHTHSLPFVSEQEATFYRGVQGILEEQYQRLMERDNHNLVERFLLLLRLRQLSAHPQVYIQAKRKSDDLYPRPDWKDDSTKTNQIISILEKETKACGFVIFCNFIEEMNILTERLRNVPCVNRVLQYHGQLSQSQRTECIERSKVLTSYESVRKQFPSFSDMILSKAEATSLPVLPLDCHGIIDGFLGNKGQHTVLLMQIQCGGTGLNLQHMNRVIFTTPWWTAAIMDQAVGRVLRLGQTDTVEIHRIALQEELETSINIDRLMYERVEIKRTLCQMMLDAADHRVA